MTRINSGVDPSELTGKHLIAEHREIKRIPNVIKSGRFSMEGQPEKFRLGTGHVKFFYDKQLYLLNRYKRIHAECKRRGYDVTDFSGCWQGVPEHLMNDWTPSDDVRRMILDRIQARLNEASVRNIA
jgi:hypothetical protein